MGVRLGPGVGVPLVDRSCLSSLGSMKVSRGSLRWGVVGLSTFSGDLGADWGESRPPLPSIIRLRSLTEEGWRDCMRRCEDGRKPCGRSGEVSTRLGICGTKAALSRAFSAMAACAVWMAVEVPVRETPGDWGFRGSGGGARSGSELSHLFFISVRQRSDITWSPRLARVDVRFGGASRTGLTWEPARGHGRRMRHAGVSVACEGHEGHPSLWLALWWLCRLL
jgi:hypothetical protein